MFAFLSRLRLPGSSTQPDDADDASSLARSLSLPWPVTEPAPRRAGPPPTPPAMAISYPIPRTAPNTLTSTEGPSHAVGPQTQSTVARPAWYEAEKPRRLAAGPPQVIRLDNNAFVAQEASDEETGDDSSPPRYSTYADAETEASYAASAYAASAYATAPASLISSDALDHPPRPSRPAIPFAEDEDAGEFYMSPFDADIDDFPVPPRASASTSALPDPYPRPATLPKARWGLRLHLQAAQSMPTLPRTVPTPVIGREHTPRGADAETDVYAHAYSYPLAAQLSPIAEQDYASPVSLRVARSGSGGGDGSTTSRSGSTGADSLGGAGAALMRNDSGAGKESVKTRTGSVRTGSGGSVGTPGGTTRSDIARPSPVYASPFLTRHLNRTVSQSSSKSDTQSLGTQCAQPPSQLPAQQTRLAAAMDAVLTPTSADTATGTMYTPTSTLHSSAGLTPTSPSKLGNTTSAVQVPPAAVTTVHAPEPTPSLGMPKIPSLPAIGPLDVRFSQIGTGDAPGRERTSMAGSMLRKGIAGVARMPVIHSDEGHHDVDDEEEEGEYMEEVEDENEEEEEGDEEDEDEDADYERESLHADSFVTAGTDDDIAEQGMELATLEPRATANSPTPSAASAHTPRASPASAASSASDTARNASHTGDSFILRRWDAACPPALTTSPTALHPPAPNARWPVPRRARLAFTPAFWTFWLGFVCPVFWLIGGWAFTAAGERPSRVSSGSWYLLRPVAAIAARLAGCFAHPTAQARRAKKLKKAVRGSADSAASALGSVPVPVDASGAPLTAGGARRRGKRRSGGSTTAKAARAGQVYPALPRWIAEHQLTDGGRMRLNDPKRSLRGISFGYPFVPRPAPFPGASLDSTAGSVPAAPGRLRAFFTAPNRALDALYGVRLMEVHGRPESGRRMFDPWIQRCRYALCYALLLVAAVLCVACAWLISVNTRRVGRSG